MYCKCQGYCNIEDQEESRNKSELQKLARRARSWIRLHPEETLRILKESGRLPSNVLSKDASQEETTTSATSEFEPFYDDEFY